MQPTIRYKKNYHVDLSDVDFQKELRLSALFGYFQDIANLAAENLGVGINQLLEKYGVAFVIMRIRVDMIRNPILDEEITIETWPLRPGKLEFERDYLVRDQNGEVIARAVSVWVIMDLKKRRLKRSEAINLDYPEYTEDRAINITLGKIKVSANLEDVYQKTIGYSDIDFNGHLNNAKYVDFIMDCFSLEDLHTYPIRSIEVNYLNEVLPGDRLVLKKDSTNKSNHTFFVDGVRESDEKIVFRSKVIVEGK